VSVICSFQLSAQPDKNCFTTEIYRERALNHPGILRTQELLEQHTKTYASRITGGHHIDGQVCIIPIVFHIIHQYGTENIADAQVEDQVRILNDDFRKRSYDTASIVPAFKTIAADCEIEFRLATIDPGGNCTNGIQHIPSPLTNNADDYSKLDPWPDNQYLNVWVVASLAWSGAAAYAYYPGTAPPGVDGIIMLSGYVGSIGTGTLGRSRVLTHEIGHYLNLAHVWGSTNNPGVACGDDNVFDTPITMGWTSCNLSGTTCGNVIENVQNYMEYSYCCNMFSEGQKTRMRAALTSSVSGRDNLWTTANLVATGTAGTVAQLCSPVADFEADQEVTCAGDTIRFKDVSWNGHPTSRSWSFPGGIPSSSTDSMPSIQYSTPGVYDATLITANASGADSITKTAFIRVNPHATHFLPFVEGFENPSGFPGTDSYVVNPDGGNTWQRVTNAASSGIASIMINNYSGNTVGAVDEYITPSFNLSGVTSPFLKFKLAYAQSDTSVKEKFQVFVSTDCGQTWMLRYTKFGSGLATANVTTSSFIPNSAEWRQLSVNIFPFQNHPDVRFKFQNISAAGNNVYLDDININGMITGDEFTASGNSSFEVFPNPAPGNFVVRFNLIKSQQINLTVTDALGRVTWSFPHSELLAGNYHFPVDKKLDAGIYFVTLEKDGERVTQKILILQE
jgi:PKD repeat protein